MLHSVEIASRMQRNDSQQTTAETIERTTQTTTWNMYSFHPGTPQSVRFPGGIPLVNMNGFNRRDTPPISFLMPLLPQKNFGKLSLSGVAKAGNHEFLLIQSHNFIPATAKTWLKFSVRERQLFNFAPACLLAARLGR